MINVLNIHGNAGSLDLKEEEDTVVLENLSSVSRICALRVSQTRLEERGGGLRRDIKKREHYLSAIGAP